MKRNFVKIFKIFLSKKSKADFLKIFFVFFIFSFFIIRTAEAKTTFYFEGSQPDKKSLEFVVWVKVDSDKPLNAYDLLLQFPAQLIRFKQFNTNDSIVNVWKKMDLVSSNEIVLQGGSIIPFQGENGQIISLIFEAINPGKDSFIFEKAMAYLADGKGTLADDIVIKNVSLSISQVNVEGQESAGLVVSQVKNPILKEDKTPPEITVFKIADDPFDLNHLFLIFETKNDSGIVKNFVRTKKWLKWSPWYEVQNPYAFSKKVWAIQFLAVDNSNNFVTKTVYRWQIMAKNLVFLVVGLIILGVLIKSLYNKLKRKNEKK